MNASKILGIIALIFAVASFVFAGPLLAAAVLCLGVAEVIRGNGS